MLLQLLSSSLLNSDLPNAVTCNNPSNLPKVTTVVEVTTEFRLSSHIATTVTELASDGREDFQSQHSEINVTKC